MPELPEVETVRRGLAPFMEGARILQVQARPGGLRFPFPADFERRLEGRKVLALSRRAKYLLADLDGDEVLAMHLGMSGSFRVLAGEDVGMPGSFHHVRSNAAAHDHVIFELADSRGDAARVVYNDPRRFGYMDLIRRSGLPDHRHFARLGLEPVGNELDGAAIARLFAGKSAPLKAALLDQSLIAGLGNIYVCEALWQARLSPLRPAGTLVGSNGRPKVACGALAASIRDVLARAIEAGGSTLRDHRLADGTLGYFQHSFRVYGREGEPCLRPRCAGHVERHVQAGRSTFACSSCQH